MKIRCPHCNLEFEVNFPIKNNVPIKRIVKINIPKQPQPIKYSDPLGRKLISGKITFKEMKGGIKK